MFLSRLNRTQHVENASIPTRQARPIRNLRWWIGGLLFTSTVINYIDRQTLSLLAPYLKEIYSWTNTDYANLLIGFRVAYAIGQTACGRLMDRVGTRRGLTLSVLWYSIVSIATSCAVGFYSFATFRFFWEPESLRTGRARRRLFQNGSPNRSAPLPLHFSIAAPRSAVRLLRF